MVMKFGMSEELGLVNYDSDSEEVFVGRDFGHASRGYGEEVAGKIDREVKKIIDECYANAKEIIQKHNHVLEACADLLLEKEKITREEFSALFDEEKRVLGKRIRNMNKRHCFVTGRRGMSYLRSLMQMRRSHFVFALQKVMWMRFAS